MKIILSVLVLCLFFNSAAYANEQNLPANKQGSKNFIYLVPYMKEFERRAKSNWKPVKKYTSLKTVVLVRVNKDGTLAKCDVIEPSGDKEADEEAIKAITSAAPYEKLPSEFKGDFIEIELTFDYKVNEKSVSFKKEPYFKDLKQTNKPPNTGDFIITY